MHPAVVGGFGGPDRCPPWSVFKYEAQGERVLMRGSDLGYQVEASTGLEGEGKA